MTRNPDALDQFIDVELNQSVMEEARFLAGKITDEMNGHALAVLFYGSCLRTGDGAGLMDFYILTDGLEGYGEGVISRFTHNLVPPFVRYFKSEFNGKQVHAKVAVMTLDRFEVLAKPKALDISIWARFAQPVALVFSSDSSAQTRVHSVIRNAIMTAMNWAVHFGPTEGEAGAYWRALFRATYAAELRIEDPSRADQIIALSPARYNTLFLPALDAIGITPAPSGEGGMQVVIPGRQRHGLKGKWLRRQIASKTINLVRILKGAVTFEGRADYVIWKIERQTGVKVTLTPWQRDHPLLASPKILFQMWRQGAFQKRH